ncbi:MAG: hypothetical protein ACPGVT_04105 [Maricaulaceae bacterium]
MTSLLSPETFVMTALTVFSALFAIALLLLSYRSSRQSELMQRELLDVVLHSKFNARRADLEESLINLGMGFQKNSKDFSDVNHLALKAQKMAENKENSFLKSLGVDEQNSEIKERQIFILTPFSKAETDTFITIRNTLLEANYQVFRGDEAERRSDILSHIVKSIIESKIIIANLNGRNPNVMYELGIAHMLRKPVLLVAEVNDDISSIPFDLQSKNILFYKTEEELREKILIAVLQVT